MFLRSNKFLVFLGKAIVFVILMAVVWTYISPAYNHLLVNLGNKLAPSDVTLQLEGDDIYIYHYYHYPYPEGAADKARIPSWGIHFGLILTIALIAATPGLKLTQRLKFIALAVIILFVVHVAIIWTESELLGRGIIDFGSNLFLVLLVPLGCDLFPVVIWGAISLKYWFPQGLARQPKLPGREGRKKNRRSR